MMRRRAWLTLPLLVAGCGLSERPFEERRDWPLTVSRPTVLPPRRGGAVLEVRTVREGPGMAARGLKTLQPDGSLRTAFYEEWLVPPAQAVEEAMRQWLAASGRFAAVVAPGSRAEPGLALETSLDALRAAPGAAHAALGVVLLDLRGTDRKVLLQTRLTAETPLAGASPAAQVAAETAALADIFGQLERAMPV